MEDWQVYLMMFFVVAGMLLGKWLMFYDNGKNNEDIKKQKDEKKDAN